MGLRDLRSTETSRSSGVGVGGMSSYFLIVTASLVSLVFLYLFLLNRVFHNLPTDAKLASPKRWTEAEIIATRDKLLEKPFNVKSYASQLPPKLDRRYVVTGGSGLVGGCIILQLLERGQSPESIRNLDLNGPNFSEHVEDEAFMRVRHIGTNIASTKSVDAAFAAPWDPAVAHLPLTVFHVAAMIVPSDRFPVSAAVLESVNIQGTRNILQASKAYGADVLIATSSGSICIRPIDLWIPPWRLHCPSRSHLQILDARDFDEPLRPRSEFFATYPYTKAIAERIVCAANSSAIRTGTIRPANGVYGNEADMLIASPINNRTQATWITPIVHSYVHGANCALAHLLLEAVLAPVGSETKIQAGRPFVVTDPNSPITIGDTYTAIGALLPFFSTRNVPPAVLLPLSYAIEFYQLLPYRIPFLRGKLPRLTGDIKHFQPGIFSVCVNLIADDSPARKSVVEGGLGYKGVVTSLRGITDLVMRMGNAIEQPVNGRLNVKSSLTIADEIQSLGYVAQTKGADDEVA